MHHPRIVAKQAPKTLLSRVHEHRRKYATPAAKRPDAFADASRCFGDFSGRRGWREGEEEKRRDENGSTRERVVLSLGLDMNNRRTHSREGVVFGEVTVLLTASGRMRAVAEKKCEAVKFRKEEKNQPPLRDETDIYTGLFWGEHYEMERKKETNLRRHVALTKIKRRREIR